MKHTPLWIDVERWERMHSRWPEEFRRTSASRFRALGNVVPEHLYPYYMLYEGRGVPVPRFAAYRLRGSCERAQAGRQYPRPSRFEAAA